METFLRDFLQDVRFAFRVLRSAPGLTITAVVSLALGIGATSSMFAVVHAALLRPLPVETPENLWFLYRGNEEQPYGRFSYPEYVDYRDALDVFEGLAAYGEIAASVAEGGGTPELTRGLIVTGNFFEVLGVAPQLGRVLGPDDDRVPGQHPVVVVSDRLWRGRFGADPEILGRTLRLNGRAYTVVGVTPRGFEGPEVLESYELYVPTMMQAQQRPPRAGFSGEMDPDLLDRRAASWLAVVGRLREGVPPEQARVSAEAIARRLADTYPEIDGGETRASIFPVERIDPRAWPILHSIAILLMSAVGLVLLVSTANVANLLLARAVSRRREIALRVALGGGRMRLARQLLTESLVLAVMGGAAGLLVAGWTLAALTALVPESGIFSFALDVELDLRVILFTLAVTLIAAASVGVAPALGASRSDLAPTIKDPDAPPAGASRARSRWGGRRALVLAQLSLSIVLLVTAGLFLRSFLSSRAVETGFAENEVLTAELPVNLLQYTKERGQQFYRDVAERVGSVPGVRSASLARIVPLQGGGRTVPFELESSAPRGEGEEAPTVLTNVVATDYFRTMDIPLVRGRDFSPRDNETSFPAAIVNQSFARTYFGGADPLGQRLRLDDAESYSTIVGVAADSKYGSLGEAPRGHVYQPLAQVHETGMTLLVRTAPAPDTLVDEVRSQILALEPDLPASNIEPLESLVESALFPARMAARLMTVFAALALTLASIGLYGVMSFAVSQRTREMGIRMALGARPGHVGQLVIGEGLVLIGLGILLGSAAAIGATRLLASFLHGVSPADPTTFVVVVGLLSAVTILTASVPARRAAATSPLVALRHE